MDNQNRLYGECAYLCDKIFETVEKWEGKWDDLINMIAAIDDLSLKTDEEIYRRYYKFLQSIYWRIQSWNEGQKFNRVSRKEVYAKCDGQLVTVPGFSIWNYDYKMYLWALDRGYTYGMNPSMIDIAEAELDAASLKRLEIKAKEEDV